MIIDPREILERGVISGLLDLTKQLQSNGIDLTLREVRFLSSIGSITVEKSNPSETKKIHPDNNNMFMLRNEDIYDIIFNESCNIPENMVARIYPRSSLVRIGAFVISGLFDSGFTSPHVGCFLYTPKKIRLEKNARIAQIVFYEARSSHLYSGQFQDGKIWLKGEEV